MTVKIVQNVAASYCPHITIKQRYVTAAAEKEQKLSMTVFKSSILMIECLNNEVEEVERDNCCSWRKKIMESDFIKQFRPI